MGQLLGKHGSNIKYLQQTTGAHIKAQMQADDNIFVTVRGSAAQVSLAVNLLQAQFTSWRCSGQPPVRVSGLLSVCSQLYI